MYAHLEQLMEAVTQGFSLGDSCIHDRDRMKKDSELLCADSFCWLIR